MRMLAIGLVLASQFTLPAFSQPAASNSAEVVCTFADGKQMKVQYTNTTAKGGEKFHEGKIWEPNGSPMTLFTEAPLSIGGSSISEGAYSMHILPQKQTWTLIVNRNVSAGSKYDEKQDLARVPMELGQTGSLVKPVQVALATVGPSQCNLRVYYEQTGAWAEFREK